MGFSNQHPPRSRHGLRRGRDPLGGSRVDTVGADSRGWPTLVASADDQRHRLVLSTAATGLCTPVRRTRSFQFVLMKAVQKSDVKPHNFVLNRATHVQLIDFGSSTPLVPGSPLIPPECSPVLCGTYDYISPEVLQVYESALVAMEMSDEETEDEEVNMGEGGYSVETDWWSTGTMIMGWTTASPLHFTRHPVDIPQNSTFRRTGSPLTPIDRSSSLLTDAKVRLSRHRTKVIIQHPFFDGTMWKPSILIRKRSVYYWLQFLTQTTERHLPELRLP